MNEETKAQVSSASALHRWLHLKPGYAPTWLCSRSHCTGIDSLLAVQAALLGIAFALWRFGIDWKWLGLAILGAFSCGILSFRFSERERFGRARRRRGECFWCGNPLLRTNCLCEMW